MKDLNINLDAVSQEDLRDYKIVFELLAEYARFKLFATNRRLEGQIDLALKHEERCESIYDGLPDWAKW